jgi:large subunit ribosomal protein L35Ae
MEGLIMNFRRARHHAYNRQMIITIGSVDDKKKAVELIGKKAVWIAPGKEKKEIVGVVSAAHGSKGYIRVVFERGMPGQAIGSKVKIE